MLRRIVVAAFVLVLLSMVPTREARASWNLAGFSGPVILTWYNSCYSSAELVCLNATLATGQSSGSAAWFTRVLKFDVEFTLGPASTGANLIWAGFEERSLIDGAEGPEYLTIAGEPYLSGGSTQPFFPLYQPGHILLWFNHGWEEPGDPPLQFGGEAIGLFDPVRVTVTPEPATIALTATGLSTLALAHRRRKRVNRAA